MSIKSYTAASSVPHKILRVCHWTASHMLWRQAPCAWGRGPKRAYSIQQRPSWEANRLSGSQEIPRLLWNPNVYYRIHTCPPPVPILSQINLVLTPHPTSWRSIYIISSHLRLGLPSSFFSSGFLTKTLYTPLLSPIRATCPAYPFFSNWSPQQYWVSTDH